MLSFILITAALAGFPAAPKAEHQISEWSLDGVDLCFASGLRVVAVRRSGSGLVRMTTVVAGGLSAETPEQQGANWAIAGLRPWSRPGGQGTAPMATAGLGMPSRATVSHNALVSHAVAPADDLAALIKSEAAWLADPLVGLDEATLDLARPQLEASGWASTADGVLAGAYQLRKQIYPEAHPGRAHALPGSARVVTWSALKDYVGSNHVPSRMTIRLEGDVSTDANALGRLVGEVLPDHLLRGEAACTRDATPEVVEVKRGELVAVRAPVAQPQVHIGWHVPVPFDPDEQWLARFADVLGTSMTSQVGFMLSEGDRAGWLEGGCGVDQGPRSAFLQCIFDLPSEQYGELASKGLIRAIPNPVQSDELALAYGAYGLHGAAALPDAMAAWDGQGASAASWRAQQTHFSGSWEESRSLTAVASIDVRTMTKRAMEVIRNDNATVVLVLPDAIPAWSSPGIKMDSFTLTSAPARSLPRPDLSGVRMHRGASGLPMWIDVRAKDQITLAAARLILPGGRYSEASPGVAQAWLTVLTWRNGAQAELLERRSGVSVRRADLGWGWQVSGRATSANLKALVWSLRHEVDVPFANYEEQFQRVAIERAVEDRLGDRSIKVVPPYPSLLSTDTRRAVVLAGHPAGVPWWERYDQARTVTAGALREHGKVLGQPARGIVVLSSSEPHDAAIAILDKYVGKWSGMADPGPASPSPKAGALPARQVALYPNTGPIAEVELSCRLPGRTKESRAALEVAIGAVATQLALRPSVQVRDVRLQHIDDGVAMLEVSVAANPHHAGRALGAVLDGLKAVADGLDGPGLAVARQQAAIGHAESLSDADSRASTLATFALDGFGPAGVIAHPDALAKVTAKHLASVLGDCVGHEVVSVIGPVHAEAFEGVADGVDVVDWRAELETMARRFD